MRGDDPMLVRASTPTQARQKTAVKTGFAAWLVVALCFSTARFLSVIVNKPGN